MLVTACSTAVGELERLHGGDPRGGPVWDPFRSLPDVRLSAEAQSELLAVFTEARDKAEEAEAKLGRARTDKTRSAASHRVYLLNGISSWAQEALLGSVSLLLVRRVDIALRRHQRTQAESADEYMADALACALECLQSCPADATFHLYVASSVDAVLSRKSLEGSIGETLPQAWQVALRHLPSILAELQAELGREPSDSEAGEALLARSRQWAAARIVEKGGEVEPDILRELVDTKLTKQGMFSAVRHIGEIRAAALGSLSIDTDADGGLLAERASPGVEAEVLSAEQGRDLHALLSAIPYVSTDMDVAPQSQGLVRELLGSELWHTLAEGGALPVEQARVSRKTPDILRRHTV